MWSLHCSVLLDSLASSCKHKSCKTALLLLLLVFVLFTWTRVALILQRIHAGSANTQLLIINVHFHLISGLHQCLRWARAASSLLLETDWFFFQWLKKKHFSLLLLSPNHSSSLIFFFFLFTLCKHSLSRVFWKCQRHHGRWVGHTYFILSDTCSILCQPPRLCLVPVRRRHEKLTVCTLPKYHVQSHRPNKWNPKIDFISMSYETSWVTRQLLVVQKKFKSST